MSILPVWYQSPLDRVRNLIYMPNATGGPHIANAMIEWLTAREAMLRGCKVLGIIDDLPMARIVLSTPGLSPDLYAHTRMMAWDGMLKSAELLDIEITPMWRSQYVVRYYELADLALRQGLLVEKAPGKVIYADVPMMNDRVLGPSWPNYSGCSCSTRDHVMGSDSNTPGYTYDLIPSWCFMVDVFDNYVPMHIRGQDIQPHWALEIRPFNVLLKLLGWRPPLEYAHVPILHDKDGLALKKSKGVGEAYDFQNWAKRFSNAEDRRHELERFILKPGAKEFSWENVVKDTDIHVNEDGTFTQTPKVNYRERKGYVMGFGPFVWKDPAHVDDGLFVHRDFEHEKPMLKEVAGGGNHVIELQEMDKTCFHSGTQSEHLKVRFEADHSHYSYWQLDYCDVKLWPGSMIEAAVWIKANAPLNLVIALKFERVEAWSGSIHGGRYRGTGEWEEVKFSDIEKVATPDKFPEDSAPRKAGYDGSQTGVLFHVSLQLCYTAPSDIELWIDDFRVYSRVPMELVHITKDVERLMTLPEVKDDERFKAMALRIELLKQKLVSPYPRARLEAQASAPEEIQAYKDQRRALALAQMTEV